MTVSDRHKSRKRMNRICTEQEFGVNRWWLHVSTVVQAKVCDVCDVDVEWVDGRRNDKSIRQARRRNCRKEDRSRGVCGKVAQ